LTRSGFPADFDGSQVTFGFDPNAKSAITDDHSKTRRGPFFYDSTALRGWLLHYVKVGECGSTDHHGSREHQNRLRHAISSGLLNVNVEARGFVPRKETLCAFGEGETVVFVSF
jgi:hypothetical protein